MIQGQGGSLGEGAARAAPTAPHATPGDPGDRSRRGASGPERFWSRRGTRVATVVASVVSLAVHGVLFPLPLTGLHVTDVEGEAAIPVDVLGPDPIAEPSPPPEPAALAAPAARDEGAGGADAGAALRDASASDAAPADASPVDARTPADGAARDASEPSARDGGAEDAGLEVASADAGGARDPQALINAIQTERVLVMLVVDAATIRKNPVGAKMGYLLRGIPQWDEFMSGTPIDPVRDTDWIVISGPSFVNTARDVVLVHYSAPDAVIDKAVGTLARRYSRGGPVDAGVPGVKATLAHADRAERVILRPQPHVLAVVAPGAARDVARQLRGAHVRAPITPGDAAYLRFVSPHRAIAEIPESIEEVRVRVIPREDDGADVLVEGDAKDPDVAAAAASDLARFVRRHDDVLTSLVTHGLLDHVEVTSNGSKVHAHLTATRDQIATLVALVGDFLGVQPDYGPETAGSSRGP